VSSLYRVLIVDDELMIREGLRTLIDWTALGYRVVDTAANAEEAMGKYELYSPDLMIIDIRMPGKNGIELIEEIRASNAEIHIIILSGYANFSYAKRALTFGIDNYLVKPVNEEELIVYLIKLSEVLKRSTANHQTKVEVLEWSRERLVQSVLLNSNRYDKTTLQLAVIEAKLYWKSYRVVLISLIFQDNAYVGSSTAVKTSLATSIEETDSGIVFSMDSYLGILLKPSFQMELDNKLVVQKVHDAVVEQGLKCIIATGDIIYFFDDLSTSYNTALERIKDYFFYDECPIIGPESVKLKKDYPKSNIEMDSHLDSVTDRLYLAMDIGNMEVLHPLIQEASQIMITEGLSEKSVKSRYVRIVTTLLSKLSNQYPEMELSDNVLDEQVRKIHEQSSLPILQKYINQLLQHYGSEIIYDHKEELINRMIDLIHRNHYENLKLEALANVFNYNSAYLGKLFKRITGHSFNTYVDRVRMDKAKELLDNGYKIHHVAKELGFSDIDYFREKFKKMEGISPSLYRKINEKP
jgi:two-component system response regulator YesN